MVFPFVRGENLEGPTFTLPADLEGAYNLLFIAFRREQQIDIALESQQVQKTS